jgi:DNA-binding MarR family transcriptional regulator
MSTPRLHPEEALYLALIKAHDLIDHMITATLKDHDISLGEYTLLRIIDNTPGVTASEAKGRLRITGPSTSGIVSSLEEKDLIIRTPDADDSRRLHLSLSSSGRKELTKIGKSFSALVQQSAMKEEALKSLTLSLSSLTSSLSLHA